MGRVKCFYAGLLIAAVLIAPLLAQGPVVYTIEGIKTRG